MKKSTNINVRFYFDFRVKETNNYLAVIIHVALIFSCYIAISILLKSSFVSINYHNLIIILSSLYSILYWLPSSIFFLLVNVCLFLVYHQNTLFTSASKRYPCKGNLSKYVLFSLIIKYLYSFILYSINKKFGRAVASVPN